MNDYNLIKQVKKTLSIVTNYSYSTEQPLGWRGNNACYEWLKVENCLELASHKEPVLKRMNLAIQPFHYSAFTKKSWYIKR